MPNKWSPTSMSRQSVQRNNYYEFSITLSDGKTIGPLETNTASLPSFENEVIEIHRGNIVSKQAGGHTIGDSSIQFHDFVDLDTEKKLLEWQKVHYDPVTGKQGIPDEYMATGTLIEYLPDHKSRRVWNLVDIFITSLELGEFSNEDKDKRQISLTLAVNYAWPDDMGTITGA